MNLRSQQWMIAEQLYEEVTPIQISIIDARLQKKLKQRLKKNKLLAVTTLKRHYDPFHISYSCTNPKCFNSGPEKCLEQHPDDVITSKPHKLIYFTVRVIPKRYHMYLKHFTKHPGIALEIEDSPDAR